MLWKGLYPNEMNVTLDPLFVLRMQKKKKKKKGKKKVKEKKNFQAKIFIC